MSATHDRQGPSLTGVAKGSTTARLGGWLPRNPTHLNVWLRDTIATAEQGVKPLRPVVREFQNLIESDAVLYMYFSLMFEQQPSLPSPPGSGDVKIKDYAQMLRVINFVLGTAPTYNTTGMVGFPINAILDFPMITPAGLAAFADPRVNDMLRKILAAWTEFLDSEESLYVLNETPTGWLSPSAQQQLSLADFQTDPSRPFLGFKSWNDFFIRPFKAGMRPVAGAEDDRVIVSACESQPFAIQFDVKQDDTFWLKGQPYSLRQMLNGNFVDEFVGGTVYQAFLSAKNYHRWHSPVSGTIKKVQRVPGTYYAEAASQGFDAAGPNNSQGYIAHTATRALIFIEADNADIGLVCVVPVGMAEVSSCLLVGGDGHDLREGQHVNKGDQIGYFQFGGSTHCVVFQKGVVTSFASQAIPRGDHGENSMIVPVNSSLAGCARAVNVHERQA